MTTSIDQVELDSKMAATARRRSSYSSSARSILDRHDELQRLVTMMDLGLMNASENQGNDVENQDTAPRNVTAQSKKILSTGQKEKGNIKSDDVSYTPVTSQSVNQSPAIPGGTPITLEQATDLRKVVYGSSIHSFSSDWKMASFKFQDMDSKFRYGLKTTRTGSRGLILCVQGFVIRYLLFDPPRPADQMTRNVFDFSDRQRQMALQKAMCDILWRAGDYSHCCVALSTESACFSATAEYRNDGISETLHLFEFTSREDLALFIKKYINYFQDYGGCILFLYSLALTRTIKKLLEDYGDWTLELLTDREDSSQPLVNLLLTGRAVPYIHNGNELYGDSGDLLAKPLQGIKDRSDIGFLFWHKDESNSRRTQVGSMLKTPKYVIWLTHINGQFSLLFSTNMELLSDWRKEHKFTLHYYTGLETQTQTTRLTIDTRFGRKLKSKSQGGQAEEKRKIPALEQCIMTKWYGAEIDWNGTHPFL